MPAEFKARYEECMAKAGKKGVSTGKAPPPPNNHHHHHHHHHHLVCRHRSCEIFASCGCSRCDDLQVTMEPSRPPKARIRQFVKKHACFLQLLLSPGMDWKSCFLTKRQWASHSQRTQKVRYFINYFVFLYISFLFYKLFHFFK